MRRLLLCLALLSTLVCAALAGDETPPAPPAAALPVSPSPQRIAQGTQALMAAVQAAEESKPDKPSFFGRRLGGLAMVVLGSALGVGSFGYTNPFADEGAARLVHSGPYSSGEATRLALWQIQYAQTEQEVYGAALGVIRPLCQLDAKAATQTAKGIKDPFWKAAAFSEIGEAQLAAGQTEAAVAVFSDALSASRSGPTLAKACTARRLEQSVLTLRARDPAAAARLLAQVGPLARDLKWTDDDAWTSEQIYWAKVDYGALIANSDPRQATAMLKRDRDEPTRLRAAYLMAIESAGLSRGDGLRGSSLADAISWLSTDPNRAAEITKLAHSLADVKPRPEDEAKPALHRIFDTFSRFETTGELAYLAYQCATLVSQRPDVARQLYLPLKHGASLRTFGFSQEADGSLTKHLEDKLKVAREQDPYYAILGDEIFLDLALYGQKAALESGRMSGPNWVDYTGPLWEDYLGSVSDFCDAWGSLARSLYLADPGACDEVLAAVQHRALAIVGQIAVLDLRPADAQGPACDRLVEAMRPPSVGLPKFASVPFFDPLGLKARKAWREYQAQAIAYALTSLDEQAAQITLRLALQRLAAAHPAVLLALLERDQGHSLRGHLTPEAVSALATADPAEAAHAVRLLRPSGTSMIQDTLSAALSALMGAGNPGSFVVPELALTRFARQPARLPEPERQQVLDDLKSYYPSLSARFQEDPYADIRYSGRMKRYVRPYQEAEAKRRQECLQELAEDWAGGLSYLASVNLAEAESWVSTLADPYQACESYRLAAQSAARTDPEGARRLLAQAEAKLAAVKDEQLQSQARGELAVAASLLDADAGVTQADGVRDPAHRAWARAIVAARLDASNTGLATWLLEQAQADLPLIKDPKRRAYVGCVLARACLGTDRDQLLAEADAPHLALTPW